MSDNFKDIKKESLPFLVDPHSWKWCFACGRRFLIVGLGVGEREGERREHFLYHVFAIVGFIRFHKIRLSRKAFKFHHVALKMQDCVIYL